uniref:Uncharacterized protein n=1 Tax=Timema monikensis TaxID=170555 RepID=A0A7R9EHY2_9NEOP|nr:unnamed protein product [Timema monikensis]
MEPCRDESTGAEASVVSGAPPMASLIGEGAPTFPDGRLEKSGTSNLLAAVHSRKNPLHVPLIPISPRQWVFLVSQPIPEPFSPSMWYWVFPTRPRSPGPRETERRSCSESTPSRPPSESPSQYQFTSRYDVQIDNKPVENTTVSRQNINYPLPADTYKHVSKSQMKGESTPLLSMNRNFHS